MRPDDAGPRISVMAPRGKPLAMRSTSGMPVEIASAAGLSRSLKAEPKRWASSDSISAFENASFTAIPGNTQFDLLDLFVPISSRKSLNIFENHFGLASVLLSSIISIIKDAN